MALRRKILLIAGIVLAAVIVVPVLRHYQWRWRLASLQAQLKAKGVPMDLAQVRPPKLSPEENGADILRQADAAFNDKTSGSKDFLETNPISGMMPVAIGKAMAVSQQPEIRNYNGTFSWGQAADAVKTDDKSIAPLAQLIDKPAFDFGFKYENGFTDFKFDQLYLVQSKRAAQRLSTAAMVDLHNGDAASAVTNIRAMLALSKAVGSERLLISQLVSIAIAAIATPPTWELLQSPNVTDEQLAALQKDWASLDFVRGEADAIAMESVMSQITAEQWRESNDKFQQYMHADDQFSKVKRRETVFGKMRDDVMGSRWRYWWSYPDEMKALQGYEIIEKTDRGIEANYAIHPAIAEQNKKIEALFGVQTNDIGKINVRGIFSASVPGMAFAVRKVESSEACKQMAVAAIALKRYQIKHGSYPANLDALVPEFLASVPLDPVDGQPLRYKLNASGGFVLYSIGENGVDDGGNPEHENSRIKSNDYWLNSRALDWVWPQPANDAEIEGYYAGLKSKR